jgi:hypothetical protein
MYRPNRVQLIDINPGLLEQRGGVLEQIRLAKSVLGVARVELDHVLDAVVRGLVDLKRLAADVPGDAL